MAEPSAVAAPLRILHVLPWVTSGGVERTRLTLARLLPKPRFEQRIVCKETASPLADRIREAGVPIDVLAGRWTIFDLRSITALRSLMRRYQPDVVHGAVFEGVMMASLMTLSPPLLTPGRARRPAVVIEEISFPTTRRTGGRILFASAAYHADACVAVSEAVGDYLRKQAGIPADRIVVIPNGVDKPDRPDASALRALRAELGIPADAFVVGSLGRMDDSIKRFSDLIRATAALSSKLPELRLLLVGGGRDLPALQALAERLGVSDRVVFTGFREDVGNMYALMNAFALVSNREAFGLVLAEALYMDLPILCSGVGGMADVVIDGETGIHVGVGDVPRIAAAIERLRVDADLRDALVARGRARVERLFSAERYASDISELYEKLAGSRA